MVWVIEAYAVMMSSLGVQAFDKSFSFLAIRTLLVCYHSKRQKGGKSRVRFGVAAMRKSACQRVPLMVVVVERHSKVSNVLIS